MDSSGRILAVILCRPTVSGDIIPVASGRDEATAETANDAEVVGLVKARVRTYFNNDGVIQLDGGYRLFYMVLLEPFCTMVYSCIGECSLTLDEARFFLNDKIRTIMASSNIQMVISQANPYDLMGLLQPDIVKFVKQHNDKFPTPQQQRIIDIRRQVNDVRAVMASNVERIMERGERLDSMETRTEALRTSATSFKSTARRVQRHFCQKNLKWTLISVAVVTVIVVAIVLSILHNHGVI